MCVNEGFNVDAFFVTTAIVFAILAAATATADGNTNITATTLGYTTWHLQKQKEKKKQGGFLCRTQDRSKGKMQEKGNKRKSRSTAKLTF